MTPQPLEPPRGLIATKAEETSSVFISAKKLKVKQQHDLTTASAAVGVSALGAMNVSGADNSVLSNSRLSNNLSRFLSRKQPVAPAFGVNLNTSGGETSKVMGFLGKKKKKVKKKRKIARRDIDFNAIAEEDILSNK